MIGEDGTIVAEAYRMHCACGLFCVCVALNRQPAIDGAKQATCHGMKKGNRLVSELRLMGMRKRNRL